VDKLTKEEHVRKDNTGMLGQSGTQTVPQKIKHNSWWSMFMANSRTFPIESKALRMIVNALWYVPNTVIRRDLQIPTVKEEIRRYSLNTVLDSAHIQMA
jgi:hypothetical protein